MKVCIIGGTGTLSLPLAKLLMDDQSVELTVINRGSHIEKLGSEGYRFWKVDINDRVLMSQYLEQESFDAVINFINYEPESIERDISYFKGKTKQYIFISTNVVLNHQDNVEIMESTEVGNRISNYGQNKAKCEAVLTRSQNFNYTIIRPSHTYSDSRFPVAIKGNNTWTVVDRIKNHQAILSHDGGQSVWPITHANDFAKLLYPVIANPSSYQQIYHIMNPTPVTWDMIYAEIAKQTGGSYLPIYLDSDTLSLSKIYDFKDAILGDKKYSNILNVDKILSLSPNFEFEYDLETGFKAYLEYMNANPQYKVVEESFNSWCDKVIDQVQTFRKNLEI